MGFIGKAWRGQERCWIVYWLYGSCCSILWILFFAVMKNLSPLVVLVGMLFYFVYIVWLCVSQWRCAFNLEWKFWGYVVRFLTAAIPLMFVIGLAIGVIMGMRTAMCRALENHPEMRAAHMDDYEKCQKQTQQGTGSAP